MRSPEPKKRLRWHIHICVHKEEYERLQLERSKSTCLTMSEYCRKVLLGKPVRVFCRDQSFDAFIEEAIALRKEMQAVREGGPFTPEGERRLITLQEEIKKCINKIFDHGSQNRKKPGNNRAL